MALEEKISKHLGKPYVYLKDQKKFLCSNGVLFTLEEYKNGIDINAEYERRAKEGMLYDYAYAKNTGFLRKKRGYRQTSEQIADSTEQSVISILIPSSVLIRQMPSAPASSQALATATISVTLGLSLTNKKKSKGRLKMVMPQADEL